MAVRLLPRGVLALAVVAGIGLPVRWWTAPASNPPGLPTVLPLGSSVVSRIRVALNGQFPPGVGATAYVPAYPGAPASSGRAVIQTYDRWRHRWRLILLAFSGIPGTAAALPLTGAGEAVVFPAYGDDGLMHYQVVALRGDRPVVLREGRVRRVEVRGDILVEGFGTDRRGLRWTGQTFQPAPPPPPAPPAATFRYWTRRDGMVHATTDLVVLEEGQVIRLTRNGGGVTVAVIPDAALDQVEGGYRARRPGIYRVTLVPGAAPVSQGFRLTLQVRPAGE